MYTLEFSKKYKENFKVLSSTSQTYITDNIYSQLKKGEFVGEKIEERTIYASYVLNHISFCLFYDVNKTSKIVTLERININKKINITSEKVLKDKEFLRSLKIYNNKKIDQLVDELISELENEINIEEEPSINLERKEKITFIISKIISENIDYPKLYGYGIDGEYTVVTNSYVVYKIKSEIDKLPFQYKPDLAKILNKSINDEEYMNGCEVDIDYNEVNIEYEEAKLYRPNEVDTTYCLYEINVFKGYSAYVQLSFLKEALDVLGPSTKAIVISPLKAIKLFNKVGDIVYLLPVKTY